TGAVVLESGDEGVREVEGSAAGEYGRAEVLLLEHVDRIIARRLRLRSFPRWAQKDRALRAAQRGAAQGGLESDGALVVAGVRVALLAQLQLRPRPGGVHVTPPSPAAREVIPLAPEALQAQYGGWEIVRRRRSKASAGFTATKPERQLDTAVHVSE